MIQGRIIGKSLLLRRSFTLLEVLIALLLVGIGSAYGGLQIFKKLKTIQLEKQNKAIIQKLQLANKLSRLSNAVISVDFSLDEDGWIVELEAKKALSSRLLGRNFRKIMLDKVQDLIVENAGGFDRIEFFPTGPFYENAKVVLSFQNNKNSSEIEIKKYCRQDEVEDVEEQQIPLPEEVELYFQEMFHTGRSPVRNNPDVSNTE